MALVMLSYPHTLTYPIKANKLTGSLLLDREYNNAVLILRGLKALPDTRTYQVWLITPYGEWTSAGLIRPQTDVPFLSEPIKATEGLANFVGLGLTIEPASGSKYPTGAKVFTIDF
jgi:anti-sigma-K factor RskA